jgi:hypothetical protein
VPTSTIPNPSQNPLLPPTLVGNIISVDTALKQPTRITRMIADITLQKFIADRVFASTGGVTGGAVIYDVATENQLYSDRDIEEVAPGGEFPIVTSTRLAPQVARVRKWGGKVFITDEARDRNDETVFQNEVRKLGNTIVKKNNTEAVAVLEASIALSGQTIIGHDWSNFTLEGTNPTANRLRPQADFGAVNLSAEQKELGVVYDLWLVNPSDYMNLALGYADKLPAVLAAAGIKEMFASNRIPAGSAYAVAEKQVGQMKLEQPLATETWREQETQRTWIQSSVRPVMFVDNPYAVMKVTGIG